MIKSASLQETRQKMGKALDSRVRALTAGLGLDELRALMRGDPPTEKPNPRYKVHTTSFLFHIRPRYYEMGSTIFAHTFRLGFLTSLFFFIELITGLILMLYYTPSPEKAYTSIVELMTNVPFGQFLRDMHRLAAEGMVIFTALHMLRTYLTGSYKKERSFTWITGVVLLGVTLMLSFSGYLLPWDQLAYWAITVGTSVASYAPVFGSVARVFLLGGAEVGQEALTRFYALHIMIIPAGIFLLTSLHIWRVRKDGGLAANDLPDDEN